MAVQFFNPTDPFGGFTGWEIQTDNPNTTNQRAQQLGQDGDEIGSQTHDPKTSVSVVYTATSDTAAIPKVGQVKSGYHIDSIAIAFTNTGFVAMTVTGHKHGSAVHGNCRTYTGSLSALTSKFGCPASIVGLTIPANAGVRSCTYTLSVNHVDELGSTGNQIGGDNYDGSEQVDVELCDNGTITAANGWTITSLNNQRGNTSAEATSATAEKHLAHDVVSQ